MPRCAPPASWVGICFRDYPSLSRFISRLTPPVSVPGSYTGCFAVDEIERIREEYQARDRTIPPDFYAWHREEIQYWQARTARVCARLLHKSGAFPIGDASIVDVGCGNGQWLLEFLQWGAVAANLHGIDLIAERIAYARGRLPDRQSDAWGRASPSEP